MKDDNSIKVDGDRAELLLSVVEASEEAQQEFCKELHAAIERAGEKYEARMKSLQPELQNVLRGTKLEGADATQVAFDVSNLRAHGVAFARARQTEMSLQDILSAIVRDDEGARRSAGVDASFLGGLRAEIIDPSRDSEGRPARPLATAE